MIWLYIAMGQMVLYSCILTCKYKSKVYMVIMEYRRCETNKRNMGK